MKTTVNKVAMFATLGALAMMAPGSATGASSTDPSTAAAVEGSCANVAVNGKADLCIASITLKSGNNVPNPYKDGTTGTEATVLVKNWGNVLAKGVDVKWTYDTIATDKVAKSKTGALDVPGYANGVPGEKSFTFDAHAYPKTDLTTVETRMTVDPDGKVIESNENNNVLNKTVAYAAPDLIVDSVTQTTPCSLGISCRITVNIKNIGTLATPKGFNIEWYPGPGYARQYSTRSESVVANSTAIPISFDVTYTGVPSGPGEAFVDNGNTTAESNEANNKKQYTASVVAPNLRITEVKIDDGVTKPTRQNSVRAQITVVSDGADTPSDVWVTWKPDLTYAPTVRNSLNFGKLTKGIAVQKEIVWKDGYPNFANSTQKGSNGATSIPGEVWVDYDSSDKQTITESNESDNVFRKNVEVLPHSMTLEFTFSAITVVNHSDGGEFHGECRFWFGGKTMAQGQTATKAATPKYYFPSSGYMDCDNNTAFMTSSNQQKFALTNVLETDMVNVFFGGREDDSGGTNGSDDDDMGSISQQTTPKDALGAEMAKDQYVQNKGAFLSSVGPEGGQFNASWSVKITQFK